jgi:hypothetical protein
VRTLLVFLCAGVFLIGLGIGAAATSGWSVRDDEIKPMVATVTENGTVKVVTTGP